MKKLFILIILLGIFSIYSCKKKEDNQDPIIEPPQPELNVLAENAGVMPPASRSFIQSIDTSSFTFVMQTGDAFIDGLKVGDIIADSISDLAPYGYLRKITAVEKTKGSMTLHTDQAKIPEAVPRGQVSFSTGKILKSQIRNMWLADGVTFDINKNPDFTVFDFDYNIEVEDPNSNAKVGVYGQAALDIDIFFNFDYDYVLKTNGDVSYYTLDVSLFEAGVELNQNASINFVAEQGFSFKNRKSLASFSFDPWVFSVGPLPVVLYPNIEIFLEVDGSVTAEFSAGASESFQGRLGVRYQDENWSVIKGNNFTTDYYLPQLSVNVESETHVGPEISLLLYGVAGPFANVTGCYGLYAEVNTADDKWNLDFIVGVNSEVGVVVDILGFEADWSTETCLLRDTLFHLGNEVFGNHIYFSNPNDGGSYGLGSTIEIEAIYAGETPDRVDFIIDGSIVASDDNEAFQYSWETISSSLGDHTLIVNEYIGDELIDSDEIVVHLIDAKWEEVDLSYLGVNMTDVNYNVYARDNNNAWIVGGDNDLWAKIFHSSDAGANWEDISPDITYAIGGIRDLLFINENELVVTDFVGNVYVAGDWSLQYGYSTTQGWMTTFNKDVCSMALGSQGYIEAVIRELEDEQYLIQEVNSVTHETVKQTSIPYHYEGLIGAPQIAFRNNLGIIYNLKDEGNALKQYIMISNNGGEDWDGKTLNAQGITREDEVEDAFFIDENRGWLVGKEQQGYAFVLITEDGGDTWAKVKVQEADAFKSVSFLSAEEGYATSHGYGDDSKLFHTLDGGNTWEIVSELNNLTQMEKVSFQGPYLGFVVGRGPIIYRFTGGK